MKERTEEEDLLMAPLEIAFGTTKYKIYPLGMDASKEWREKVNASLADIVATFGKPSEKGSGSLLSLGIAGALLQFPDKLLHLLFEYAPQLKEQSAAITAQGTPKQLNYAIEKILGEAYPFHQPLALLTDIARAANLQASAPSSSVH